MSWTFEQSTGKLYDPQGRFISQGYSGAPGFIDNPDDQALKDRGVLPRGLYTIGSAEDSEHTGPLSLPLTPDPGNEMFDRGGFLIHGDSVLHPGCASEGCIVLPYVARIQVAQSTDKTLQVVERFTPNVAAA